VSDFEGWLRHTAHQTDPNQVDDLIQEGRIAMWRNEQRRGLAHAGWMTAAARQRMRDVAWSGWRMFGNEGKRGQRSVEPVASMEEFEGDTHHPTVADFAEMAAMAYHHGEMARAIGGLSPRQQEAARVVLAGGILDEKQRAAWTDARKKLRELLAHLGEGEGNRG